MKNKGKARRGIAALLTTAMCVSCLPVSALAAKEELSPEALRVSDEFAAKYPNGLLDIVNQNTITDEDSGEIEIYIARRGGTEGEVDVSLKAIEMTAKYGEDFVFVEDGLFSSHEVEKVLDTPTLLESSLADYGDEPITVEGAESDANSEGKTTEDVPKTEENTAEEDNGAAETATENNGNEEIIVPDTASEETTTEETQVSSFDENREYSSSLHKMRDEILNANTKAEVTSEGDLTKLFDVDNKEDIMRDEAMSAVMPGAFINLHFDEGENYKVVKIKIIDDDIVEDDEAFMLGLFDCTGAEFGNNITSNVCIKDNDERTEDTKLYFEEGNVSAYDQNSTVRLKVMRSNNIETYQLLEVQTMANTAKADTNYSSLVTEAVLLAGQEYKYIDIPIKSADITEPVDFEVRVTGTGKCNSTSATVTIYPENEKDDSNNNVSVANNTASQEGGDVSLLAEADQPVEVISGTKFSSSSYADSGRVFASDAGMGCLELNSDAHRWGCLYYDLDLRGIAQVDVTASGDGSDTKYPSRVKHDIYIEGGGKTINKQKNWESEKFTFNVNEFSHKPTRLVAHADSTYWNDTRLWIHDIKLYKQQILLSFEQPDNFKIPIYKNGSDIVGYYTENGSEKVVAPQASISALNNESSRPSKYYRDDTVTLSSSLSSEGQEYGAYLKGYELYNPATQTYKYFEGTDLTLNPEIIGTYVYGDNKNYSSVLKVKPVYGRRATDSKLTIGNFATHKGSISVNGETLSPNTVKDFRFKLPSSTIYSWQSTTNYLRAGWEVGDYLAIDLKATDGYTATAINDIDGNKISEGTTNTMYIQLKESGNSVVPVFSRNDCGVTFLFEGNTDGLYVFHDKKNYADNEFLNALYKDTTGLTNWTTDETPVFTGLFNQKVKSNYDVLRSEQKLNGQKLSNLAIGDVVTVYAEAPDGYIPYWYIDDANKTVTTENDKIYAKHYGNSFSFEMTSNDVTLTCGMEKKTAENYVMTGKLIKPSKTLKGQGYSQVNPNVPDSYMTIPDAALSVVNFDERKDSVVIDGVKYYSSTTTDKDGNFRMYVPNVSEREYFSVKYSNGIQAKATTLLAANGKTYYIVVPANDENYTVKSIDCRTTLGDLAETNGLINIPYKSEGANRSFIVNTVRSNDNYVIGAAYLNSYRSDGSLVKSVSLQESYSSGLETTWRADVNITEMLADNGRLTVELFDKNGVSRGEVETGYTLEKEMEPVSMTVPGMPDQFATQDSVNVPVVGSNVPVVPNAKLNETPNDKTLEIAVGQGKTLKNAIYSQLEAFNNSDNMSKMVYLTKYVAEDNYNVNVGNEKTSTPKEGTEDTTSKFPMLFDFGMYLKLDKNDDGTLSFDYLFVTVAFSAVYSKNWHAMICGFPLYLSLSAGGSVRGLIGLYGTRDDLTDRNIKNKEFYALLGKYGKDQIANKNYSVNDETTQKLFAAIYNQANLTEDMSQAEDALVSAFNVDKETQTAAAIDKLLDRYDLYYLNEKLFEAKAGNFSIDLQNRISVYKQLVTLTQRIDDSNVIIDYDASTVDKAWIHRLNLRLLIESLPEYIYDGKLSFESLIQQKDSPPATGIVTLRPSFSIGAGLGARGIISAGVSGHIDFIINWEPWTEAKGTVTFSVNADVDIFIIPLTVRLAGYTVKMFETSGYVPNDFDKEIEGGSGMVASLMNDVEITSTASVDTNPKRRTGNDTLQPVEDLSLFESRENQEIEINWSYQTETTKHPQPNIFFLPNGNRLLVYMNDNLERALYDRNSIYYSIFDKTTNEWSSAVELESDGTLDGDIKAIQLDDGRVVVAWTNGDKTFGDDLPNMADFVTSQNISLCIFDAEGKPGDIHDITNLEDYGYSEPNLAYDDDIVTIAYKITDYHADNAKFDYNDQTTYQSFMANSYESLAVTEFNIGTGQIVDDQNANYALFEEESGIDLNGMRFVNADVGGLENPKLYDIEVATFRGKTYIFYSADIDNNISTDDDRELFCVIRENGENSKPIRLTDNNVKDSNANVIARDGFMTKVYFGSGGKICTIDLESITESNWEDRGNYYVMKNAETQTDSILEYESAEAAEGFRIFRGADNLMYMMWSEFKTTEDKDKKTHKSRVLCLKAYDPMFTESEREDEEYGNVKVYTGAWGLTQEVVAIDDAYTNEASLAVSENGEYALAYRMFKTETVKDENNENITYEKEASISILTAVDAELVSSISMTKTNQYPLYPSEKEAVTVDFEAENYGSIPSDEVNITYYLETDADIEGYDELNGCTWSKDDGTIDEAGKSIAKIASTKFEDHISSGEDLYDSIQFVMPKYDKEVNIVVLAKEDDNKQPTKNIVPIEITPVLEATDLDVTLSDDEREFDIQGIVSNNGNYPAKNVVISVYTDGIYDIGDIIFDSDNTKFNKEDVNQKVIEITVDSLEPGESFDLGYTVAADAEEDPDEIQSQEEDVKLSDKYFTNDGKANFTVSAEYDVPTSDSIKKNTTVLGYAVAEKDIDTIPSLTNINVNIPSDGDEVSALSENDIVCKVPVGEQKAMNVTLEPYGSAKGYSLVYESGDDSVAEVNSSNGKITGISKGKTKVTVKAFKNNSNNIVIVDRVGNFWLNDGTLWDFANDTSTNDDEVVMTKEIDVEVTDAEATATPTTKPHRGGGGGSSVKATATPTPEATATPIATLAPNTTATPSDEKLFNDVSENAWYYDAVKYSFENGLMLGIGDKEFEPETELTRAMFVTILYRLEGKPDISDDVMGYPFGDVEPDSWYADAVYWARKNEIVNGISNDEFAPDDRITREQMAAMIFRYAKYKGIDAVDTSVAQIDFADLAEISDWAKEAVIYCNLKGLMEGKDNNIFDPKNNATRAETSAILQRLTENKYTSDLGYSMTYNPTMFTLDSSGSNDTFAYNSKEKTAAPVYITVQPRTDVDVKTAADGLILQSGRDDVKATEAYFGADSITTQNVYIEKDVDGVKQIQVFYVIPVGGGSMIVEIGSYVETDAKTDAAIEEMLGTFSVNEAK